MAKLKKKANVVFIQGTTDVVAGNLKRLPNDVFLALLQALSRFLSRYHCDPDCTSVWSIADELRYWNVSAFSWWYGSSGVGIHFSFNSFQVLGL